MSKSIFTYKNLYRAYLDCRQTKRKTVNAIKFEINLEENLNVLLSELESSQYQPGRSICFVVTKPVPREIFAADFRDRIVHHLFVRELMDKAEKMFIFDSFACRPGKGTHKAVKRVFDFSRSVSRGFRDEAWYMKVDIASFFMSIDKNRLYLIALNLIDKHNKSGIWKNEMSDLAGLIIFHRPQDDYIRRGNPELAKLVPAHKSLINCREDKGLPIGNYSSQFFANLYMNKVDHFIKRSLKCQQYVGYVDDLILFSRSKSQLKEYLKEIDIFVIEKLGLRLNKNKTIIQPVDRGIDFLGYYLKQNKIYARDTVVKRYKNRLYPPALGREEIPWLKLKAIAASYDGHSRYFD